MELNSKREIHLLNHFLEQAHGSELAILSQKGMLRASDGSGRKVTHHNIKADLYTIDDITKNDAAREKVIVAFRQGFLGVKLEDNSYAFNQTLNDQLKKAEIRVISASDSELPLRIISDKVYSKYLTQINLISVDPSTYEDIVNDLIDNKEIEISEESRDTLLSCANLDESSLARMHRSGVIDDNAYTKLLNAL